MNAVLCDAGKYDNLGHMIKITASGTSLLRYLIFYFYFIELCYYLLIPSCYTTLHILKKQMKQPFSNVNGTRNGLN
jgi:hypothetical protein